MVSIIIENSVLFCNYENSKRERAYSAVTEFEGSFQSFATNRPSSSLVAATQPCNSNMFKTLRRYRQLKRK